MARSICILPILQLKRLCILSLEEGGGLGALGGPQKPTKFKWPVMHSTLSVGFFFHLEASSFY